MPRAKTPKYDPRERQKRQDTVVSHLDLEGDIDDVIERLRLYKENNPGYTCLKIDLEWGGGYDCSDHYDLIGHRLENDEEYALRMEVLAQQEARAELERRSQRVKDEAEFARLAKKLRKKVVDA